MHRHFVAQFAILAVLATVLVCALWPEERALTPQLLSGVTTVPFVSRVSHHYEGVAPEQNELFAILDEFFPYDVDGLPFVRVVFPVPLELRRDPDPGLVRHGFLMEETKDTLRVRFLDGQRAMLPRVGSSLRKCRFEPSDLVAHGLDLARDAQQRRHRQRPEEPISTLTRSLLVARVLARNGRTADVQQIWAALGDTPNTSSDRLLIDLDHRVVLDFDDPSLTWSDLLARSQRILALGEDQSLRRCCEELQELVAGREPRLTDSRIAAVARELRQTMRPLIHNWDSFNLPRWEPLEHDAFLAVGRRGADAVRALVALLDDRSVTRSVGYGTRKGLSAFPRRLGDVAKEALETMFAFTPGIDEDMPRGREQWLAFHERIRDIGLQKHLLAKLRAEPRTSAPGYHRGPDAAQAYVQLWPELASDVLEAAEASADPDRKLAFASAVFDATEDPRSRERAAALLRTVAAEGNTEQCGRAAWWLLDEFDDVTGVKALHERWLRGNDVVLPLLLRSGLVEPWVELERRLVGDGPDRRELAHVAFVASHDELLERATPESRLAIDAVLRRCLVRLLEDTSPAEAENIDSPHEWIWPHEATRADVAAMALAAWWPAEFVFDGTLTASGRHRQIDAILAAQGRPVLQRRERRPGATPDRLGPVVLGTIAEPLTPECEARIRAIGDGLFTAKHLLADLEAIAQWHHVATTAYLERTDDGDGWSIVVDVAPLANPKATSPAAGYVRTVRGHQHAGPYDYPQWDDVPAAGAAEFTFRCVGR